MRDIVRLAVVPSAVVGLWPAQPMAGRFDLAGDQVSFVPRFPLVPGTSYSLLVDGIERDSTTVPAVLRTASTRVVALYPTATAVPLNLLKLYVEFSAPMSEGWAARMVRVRRADDGRPIPDVFLPGDTELWDRARRRLTMLLDPGRIKRGLGPQVALGYPLEAGVPIVVSVEAGFLDEGGARLAEGIERRYAVGAALRERVDPAAWRVYPPRAGSRQRLVVRFDRPLDHALLDRCLKVVDAYGQLAVGAASVAAGDAEWRFAPRAAWQAGVYRLLVDARLEDVAGNSLRRVFDRDLTRVEDTPIDVDRRVLTFRTEP
ncbi:MAG: hypothetical protein JO023_13030 [Chloroflexi bacterium]|nr:hypothetical protein [Chloroflexota bacterium]